MTKYVREMKHGKSVSAFVVLNKRGEHVATVQAEHSDAGSVTVNVWNYGNAAKRCAAAANAPAKSFHFQHGKAGGYGYDKFAAALRGLWVDGHHMADHCGRDARSERLLSRYMKADDIGANQAAWDAKAAKIGAQFANWSTDRNRFTSLHIRAGLDALSLIGYRVISAI